MTFEFNISTRIAIKIEISVFTERHGEFMYNIEKKICLLLGLFSIIPQEIFPCKRFRRQIWGCYHPLSLSPHNKLWRLIQFSHLLLYFPLRKMSLFLLFSSVRHLHHCQLWARHFLETSFIYFIPMTGKIWLHFEAFWMLIVDVWINNPVVRYFFF